MALSVADIAAKAFTAVAGKVTGVIKPATLTRSTNGTYDPVTGSYTATSTSATGRVLFATADLTGASGTKIADLFPDYVAGPLDHLVYCEGMSLVPTENDALTVEGVTYSVLRGRDILLANGLAVAIARAR